MPKGKKNAGGSSESGGLHRLPPGRHGLRREFVEANQRDRITAGTIASIAAQGYHQTTVSDIASASGVSRRTFYIYFSSKEECFLATYDLIAEHLLETASTAAASEQKWTLRVRAALGATLGFFAANPDLVRFMLMALPRAGEQFAPRYRQSATRALGQLLAGMPPEIEPPSAAVQNAVLGGMAGLVVRKVEAGEGDRLPELLPDLLQLFLSPYVGREEAARVANAR
jgi:AcrR family transcriptional regulator